MRSTPSTGHTARTDATAHTAHGPGFYIVIYLALVVLLALTVGVAFLPLGILAVTVALVIATIKGLLVVLYFMHLRESSGLTWLFVISGFLWLVLLLSGTASDFLTRPVPL